MTRVAVAVLAILATLAAARAAPAPAPAAPAALSDEVFKAAAQYEFGKSRKDIATVAEYVREARPAQYRTLEAKLLGLMKAPGTTVDAKRYFCRYLGIVGSAQSIPVLAALLDHEQLSGPARIALEPMTDAAAGTALRQALGRAKGKVLAGLVGSIGVRRDAQAVPALAELVGSADADVSRAAVAALGAIGTADAAKALDQAAAKAPEPLQRPLAQARLVCAAALAQAGKRTEAVAIYRSLLDSKEAPASRLAALRGLIAAEDRAAATKLICDRLQSDDAAVRAATLAAFASSAEPALKTAVVDQLPALKPAAQEALLGLLADAPEIKARAALVKLVQESKDGAVRLAAIDCLATHGQGEDVPLLVKLAVEEGGTDAAVARKVLERMAGPGVNEAIAGLLGSADAKTRGMAMTLVTSRRIEAALPALVKMTAGADAAVAADAVKALAALGTAAEVPGLMKILVETKDAPLRAAVQGAVGSICTRETDREACGRGVLPALDTAAGPEARVAVLQLLPRVGTAKALAAAKQALTAGGDAQVSQAALRALGDWPDTSAAPALLDYAKATQTPTDAVLAIRGCLRLAGLREQPVAERLSIYRRSLDLAARPEEKKLALAGLAELLSADALDLLVKCAADKTLGDDAVQAALRLAAKIGPVAHKRTEAALKQLKALPLTGDAPTRVDEALKALAGAGLSPDGYILAWMLSGPYTQEGKGGNDMLGTPFPPEKPAGKAEWQPCAVPANKPLVELNVILGGNERAAYLKTEIGSPKAQDAVLELGSDDGVKVWLNGQVVHENNTTRACAPGQDKVKIRLKQGANPLLVKVAQGGGEWSVIARLRAADGGAIDAGVGLNE